MPHPEIYLNGIYDINGCGVIKLWDDICLTMDEEVYLHVTHYVVFLVMNV